MIFANIITDNPVVNSLVGKIKDGVIASWNWLVESMQALATGTIDGAVGLAHYYFPTVDYSSWTSVLSQINYVFPLNETIVLTEALLTFFAIVFSYRLIKSWIPTDGS